MKKYLQCTITRSTGETFINELKLSEAHLIGQIVKENKSCLVELKIVPVSTYKIIFGQ